MYLYHPSDDNRTVSNQYFTDKMQQKLLYLI